MLPPGVCAQQGELVLVRAAPASYLGVNIRTLDAETARVLGLDRAGSGVSGVVIVALDHDAPAGKAGLQLRDVVTALDGKPVTNAAQFRESLRGDAPGAVVAMTVLREGRALHFSVRLADRAVLEQQAWASHFNVPMPSLGSSFSNAVAMQQMAERALDPEGEADGAVSGPGLGAELDPIGPQLAHFFGAKDGTGLLVKSVDPESPAGAAGLLAGDVVVRLNDQPTASLIDWMRAVDAGQGRPLQLTVMRARRSVTVVMVAPKTQAGLAPWAAADGLPGFVV